LQVDGQKQALASLAEQPYSMATDGDSPSTEMSRASVIEAENPYQQIDYMRTEDLVG